MLVVGALCVQLFGLYDLKGEALGLVAEHTEISVGDEEPETSPAPAARGADKAVETAEPAEAAEAGPDPEIAKEVTRFVGDARRAIEDNRLKTAAEKLQNAKLLDPDRVEVYELLATVYTEMGQEEEAEAARQKVGDLKAAAEGDGDAAGEKADKND
jgi:predicted Zn-dependent protease